MQRTKKNMKEERRKEGGKEGRTLPTNIYRTSIIHPTNINRKKIEHICWESVRNLSNIHPTKILRKSTRRTLSTSSENNKIHAQLNQHHTISMKTQMLLHCNPTRKSANNNRFKKGRELSLQPKEVIKEQSTAEFNRTRSSKP